METKFQTSFIPKKPLLPQESVRAHSPTNLLMVIATIAFLVSLGGAGFVILGKTILLKAQEQAKKTLTESEKRFNLPLIEELKNANSKIDLANQLLRNHIAASEALAIIGGLTAERIRFSSFEFSSGASTPAAGTEAGTPPGQPETMFKVRMKGIADSFNSVAFQSDVFGRSGKYGTNKILKNPVLSDLTVDQSGQINFNFAADISLSDISYEKVLMETLKAEGN